MSELNFIRLEINHSMRTQLYEMMGLYRRLDFGKVIGNFLSSGTCLLGEAIKIYVSKDMSIKIYHVCLLNENKCCLKSQVAQSSTTFYCFELVKSVLTGPDKPGTLWIFCSQNQQVQYFAKDWGYRNLNTGRMSVHANVQKWFKR